MSKECTYSGIEYFELYPLSCNARLRLSFDDTVESINKKISGVICNNVSLSKLDTIQNNKMQGIKTDIQISLSPSDEIRLTSSQDWTEFKDYRYCALQLYENSTIDILSIYNIKDINIDDKHRSKIMTPEGEVSIYEICTTLKMLNDNTFAIYKDISSTEIFKDIQVILFENSISFINLNKPEVDRVEHISKIFAHLGSKNVTTMLGSKPTFEWLKEISPLK